MCFLGGLCGSTVPVSELEPNSDEPISMSSSLSVVLAEGYDQGRCQRIGVSDSRSKIQCTLSQACWILGSKRHEHPR